MWTTTHNGELKAIAFGSPLDLLNELKRGLYLSHSLTHTSLFRYRDLVLRSFSIVLVTTILKVSNSVANPSRDATSPHVAVWERCGSWVTFGSPSRCSAFRMSHFEWRLSPVAVFAVLGHEGIWDSARSYVGVQLQVSKAGRGVLPMSTTLDLCSGHGV